MNTRHGDWVSRDFGRTLTLYTAPCTHVRTFTAMVLHLRNAAVSPPRERLTCRSSERRPKRLYNALISMGRGIVCNFVYNERAKFTTKLHAL